MLNKSVREAINSVYRYIPYITDIISLKKYDITNFLYIQYKCKNIDNQTISVPADICKRNLKYIYDIRNKSERYFILNNQFIVYDKTINTVINLFYEFECSKNLISKLNLNNCIYYVGNSMMFDSELNIILSFNFKIVFKDDEIYLKPQLIINPNVFIDKKNTVYKYIRNHIIPYIVNTEFNYFLVKTSKINFNKLVNWKVYTGEKCEIIIKQDYIRAYNGIWDLDDTIENINDYIYDFIDRDKEYIKNNLLQQNIYNK